MNQNSITWNSDSKACRIGNGWAVWWRRRRTRSFSPPAHLRLELSGDKEQVVRKTRVQLSWVGMGFNTTGRLAAGTGTLQPTNPTSVVSAAGPFWDTVPLDRRPTTGSLRRFHPTSGASDVLAAGSGGFWERSGPRLAAIHGRGIPAKSLERWGGEGPGFWLAVACCGSHFQVDGPSTPVRRPARSVVENAKGTPASLDSRPGIS